MRSVKCEALSELSDDSRRREDGQCTCAREGMRLEVRFYLFMVSRLVKLRIVIHDRGLV